MTELRFTDVVHNYISSINPEKLADTGDVQTTGEHIAKLAQFLTRTNQELANRQWVYNLKVKLSYEGLEKKSVALAKMESESSQEWKDLRDCIAVERSIIEMIRSLKFLLRGMSDEYKHTQ